MRFGTRLFAFVLILVTIAPAQQFWEKKPWTQWNKREVEQLLENSPWAKSQTQSSVDIQVAQRSMRGEGAVDSVSKVTYVAQLRSAKIVRQAIVRQAQLKSRYDDMNPEQKAAFDAKTQPFLDGPPGPQIAVHVSFDTTVPGQMIELQNHWTRQTTGLLQNTVFLSLPGGRKISPLDYTPPRSGGFVFIFERLKDIPSSGELRLEFMGPGSSNPQAQRISIGFNLARMVVNGNLDF